jgi:hypothetical protein
MPALSMSGLTGGGKAIWELAGLDRRSGVSRRSRDVSYSERLAPVSRAYGSRLAARRASYALRWVYASDRTLSSR